MENATPAVLLLIILFICPVVYFISWAKRNGKIYIRRIAGVDAIDDAIGRSIELGRPLSFTSGLTSVGPLLYACLGVLHYVAQKAAVFNSRLFVPCSDPQSLALTEATLQNAYRKEKKFNTYDPSTLRFLSEEQLAYASGYQGLVHRENVGAAFLFGTFAAESLILAEAGQQISAMQIAATTSPEQIPFFLTTCDYTLLGEELYAAGAYLSKDPVQTGSLRGQDFAKLVILLLIVVGIIQATYNSIFQTNANPMLINWIQMSWSELSEILWGLSD